MHALPLSTLTQYALTVHTLTYVEHANSDVVHADAEHAEIEHVDVVNNELCAMALYMLMQSQFMCPVLTECGNDNVTQQMCHMPAASTLHTLGYHGCSGICRGI